MKKILNSLILFFVTAAGHTQSNTPADIIELDRIVAVVNTDVIVKSELRRRIREVRKSLENSGTPPPSSDALSRQVLERLILERLQLQIAENNGIRINDNGLNRAIENIAKRNQLSLRKFRDVLERDGVDFAKFREQIRNEMLLTRVRQRSVASKVSVTPREIDNYLATVAQQGGGSNEYHIGHILVAVPEAATSEQISAAREEAEEIIQRLNNGEDFAQLAATESDGQQALEGGDLGWRKSTELPTIFSDLIPKMKPGELTSPIHSPSGFHIVKLKDLRGDTRYVIKQVHARHILIRTNDLISDADAQTRLQQLKIRIENNDDFSELARSHSDDTASATQGGDLGWLNPGDTVPLFENQMKQLVAGEVSKPFQTQFGWHIVQVIEHQDFDDTEKVRRTKAAGKIRKRKLDEEVQSWLRQLRDESFVELRLDDE